MIDPANQHFNSLPPPVHIEQLIADKAGRSPIQNSRLPALTRDIQIDYTALSFAMPQRVRFRYRLDGHDANWQEAGTRRSAFYTNLAPGTYRFHVIACNNDGVWNEQGASSHSRFPVPGIRRSCSSRLYSRYFLPLLRSLSLQDRRAGCRDESPL